jgi:hypothetical protein
MFIQTNGKHPVCHHRRPGFGFCNSLLPVSAQIAGAAAARTQQTQATLRVIRMARAMLTQPSENIFGTW